MKLSYEKRTRRMGYLFISPWIFGAVGLLIFPVVFSLMLSFSKLENVLNYRMDWVGMSNFVKAFREDVDFLPLLIKEVQKVLLRLPLITVFALIVGILLSKKIACRGLFRTIFFLPVILGSGTVMEQLLSQGVNNEPMEMVRDLLLTPEVQLYLGQSAVETVSTFLASITLVMWKSGVQILLILGGLQSISPSLYESARIDSATEWEMFWKITLPMVSPVLLITVVYTIVDSFADSGSQIMEYISKVMFKDAQFEYAASLGWIYFAVVIVFVAVAYACLTPSIRNVSEN